MKKEQKPDFSKTKFKTQTMKRTKTALLVLAAFMFTQQAKAQAQNTPVDKDGTPVEEVAPKPAKIPWDGFDLTWVNGNDRRDSSIFHIPYFTPSIMIDNNFTHSFNDPIDHTV